VAPPLALATGCSCPYRELPRRAAADRRPGRRTPTGTAAVLVQSARRPAAAVAAGVRERRGSPRAAAAALRVRALAPHLVCVHAFAASSPRSGAAALSCFTEADHACLRACLCTQAICGHVAVALVAKGGWPAPTHLPTLPPPPAAALRLADVSGAKVEPGPLKMPTRTCGPAKHMAVEASLRAKSGEEGCRHFRTCCDTSVIKWRGRRQSNIVMLLCQPACQSAAALVGGCISSEQSVHLVSPPPCCPSPLGVTPLGPCPA